MPRLASDVGEFRRTVDWSAVESRLRSGDWRAFLELNRLIRRVLERFRAYDFMDEWDDLRQEVSLAVVGNARRGRLRDGFAFAGYVRAITRNKLMDHLRRRLRLRDRELLCWDVETEPMASPLRSDDPELRRDLQEAGGRYRRTQRPGGGVARRDLEDPIGCARASLISDGAGEVNL